MTLPTSQPNYFDSSETGAPTLNNVASSFLEVVRACAKNGFNPKTVTSIDVASGVATASAAAHGYSDAYGKLLLIEGCSEAALNGRKQPLSVATNTFTFDATGVADGTYTGTMSAKRAPLGWTEPHTGTNVAMFARSAPEAGTQLLRILDSAAAPASTMDARAMMVESATDVDTYTNKAPSAAQVTDGHGGWIGKGANSATAKPWALVGTDRGFYFIGPDQTATPGETARMPYFFGDGVRLYPGDEHLCLLAVNAATVSGGSSTSRVGVSSAVGNNWATGAPIAAVVARSRDGASVSEVFDMQGGPGNRFGAVSSMVAGMPEKLYMVYPIQIVSNFGTKEVRGIAPGLAAPIANLPFSGLGATSVMPADELDGRRYLAVQSKAGGASTANYCIDLSGPWYG